MWEAGLIGSEERSSHRSELEPLLSRRGLALFTVRTKAFGIILRVEGGRND